MRDVVICSIFAIAAAATLKRPYYGALLWVWIGLMNPHRLAWGFAYSLPFAMAAAGVTILGMLMNSKQVRAPKGFPLGVLAAFLIWMGLTTAMAIHVEPSVSKYIEVIKIFGMLFVVSSLVRTREEIIGLVWVIVLSIGYFGFKGGLFTILTGGGFRVWGPPSSLVSGNNEIAIAFIMIIPLMYFLVQQAEVAATVAASLRKVTVKWIQRGLYAGMVLTAASAVGSHSRGALLAIVAMGAMLWWRSKSKAALGFGLLLLTPLLFTLMPEEWFSRMNTIQTYEEDESAQGRLNAWAMAFNIANDRVFGAGFATATQYVYALYAPDPTTVLVAHSIYFQILGDHGYIGLLLYLTFWISTYRLGARLTRVTRGIPEVEWAGQLGAMARVSLVGFAVGGAFLSLAYWDMPFYICVLMVAADRLVQQHLTTTRRALHSGVPRFDDLSQARA
ncbi:MAG: putative O-glycosylation ligase, exosortase A system-associated [Ferrovibrio sp.]|uniref:putative O-glycosylation ligase, exosortase A system-associated n=1 Tax=Ferrovibrio sp. TaxID=1917215 RepID=UPI002608AD3D|nr:putative O-glycosylation ligase, exosortase A system-associated [Ferrovibrio sp.]MCW0232836.1 putative O-glycosylation ligase, exosortase A system-associated [Ferrovibrio sp.]